jgi:hypothetical protein
VICAFERKGRTPTGQLREVTPTRTCASQIVATKIPRTTDQSVSMSLLYVEYSLSALLDIESDASSEESNLLDLAVFP